MPFTGPRIRELREAVNMTREELAVAASCSYSSVVLYEQDRRRPSTDIAERLAQALGVTVDDLLKPSAIAAAASELNRRAGADGAVTNTGVLEDVAAVVAPSPRASSEAA